MAKPLIERIDCNGLVEASLVAAEIVARTVAETLASREVCSVSLTGGTTPRSLYARMAADSDTEWNRVRWYWSDERCVAPDHPESNYRMTRELFLEPASVRATQIHRMEGEREPTTAANDYNIQVQKVADDGGFDLVILGMGEDGHVASLFPGHSALKERSRFVVAIEGPDHLSTRNRITWTLPAIAMTRQLMLLTAGDAKRRVVDQIFANRDDCMSRYPAARVTAGERVLWITG